MSLLNIGDAAPNFTLLDGQETAVTLADTAGQWRVLYFYPKASTPGCTVQACSIRDNNDAFTKLNVLVYGISPDPSKKIAKFNTAEELDTPALTLLGDESKETLEAYGVWQEKSMYGRKYMGVARVTYIVNPVGKIAHVMPKVSPKTHTEDVLKFLQENM